MRLVKPARLCMGAMLLVLLSVWSMSAVQQAFAWGSPKDLDLRGVPCGGSNCQIYSVRLAGESNRVHLIYGQKDSKQLFYNRGTTAADGTVTWEAARSLAKNVTVQNVPTWDIVADPNGTIHLVYYSSGTIYYIKNTQHGDFGNWSSPEAISSSGRPNNVVMKLDAAGTPYVAWTQGFNESPRFAYRGDDGSWNVRNVNLRTYFMRKIDIAVIGSGDTATVHVMTEYERGNAQPYAVYYAHGTRDNNLNASKFSEAFSNSACSCERPRIVVDPSTNVLYAGFVGGSQSNGYFWGFTRSQDNGQSWSQLSRVRAGDSTLWADETPMVAANNVVYLDLPAKKWNGSGFSQWGSVDVRYNATSNSFTGPVPILDYGITNGKLDRAIAYAINQNAKVAVWIRNYIDGPGYTSDPGGIDLGSGGAVSGQVAFNGGATTTTSATVTVNINNVIGNPTQMRVAVDTPMSDAIPLQAFQASFPVTFTNLNVCQHTVAVTLVNAQGVSTTNPLQANITVDAAVQASVLIGNPLVGEGDNQYTRSPNVYTVVSGGAECTGLKQASIGKNGSPYNDTNLIQSNYLAKSVFIRDLTLGSNQIAVDVQDNVGNEKVYTGTIIYDDQPPTLVTSGTLTVQAPTSGPSVFTTLVFSGSVVRDNLYPAPGFWGVQIANSRTPITNTLSDLTWSTVQRPGTSGDFTLQNWSVLSGIPAASQTAGDYYVYVRFLDGAGNATSGVISNKVTLQQVTKPTVTLPIVIR